MVFLKKSRLCARWLSVVHSQYLSCKYPVCEDMLAGKDNGNDLESRVDKNHYFLNKNNKNFFV